jgi:hypothetical protein
MGWSFYVKIQLSVSEYNDYNNRAQEMGYEDLTAFLVKFADCWQTLFEDEWMDFEKDEASKEAA